MQPIKIDLTEQLGDGQYVMIRDPRLLPWGEQKKLQAQLKDESIDSQIAFAEQLTVSLAKDGNIQEEDGTFVQFPLNGDSVAKLPAIVVESIAQKFAELRGKAGTVEKK